MMMSSIPSSSTSSLTFPRLPLTWGNWDPLGSCGGGPVPVQENCQYPHNLRVWIENIQFSRQKINKSMNRNYIPEGHWEFWGSKTAVANCLSEMAQVVGSRWSSIWPCWSASCKVKKRDRWQAQASATAVGSSSLLARKRIRNLRLVSWCVTKFNNHLPKRGKTEKNKQMENTGKFWHPPALPW